MFIGQNPGVSPERAYEQDRRLADALGTLARQPTPDTYRALCSVLEVFMHSWSITQTYVPLAECGLALEDVAYLNVARCRTAGNGSVPPRMADNCVSGHLGRWLDVLEPRVVVFLGKWAHQQAVALVEQRKIPHAFINRQRSLSGEERSRNRAEVVRLVKEVAGTKSRLVINAPLPPPVAPPKAPTQQQRSATSHMGFQVYAGIFRRLGFTQIERGKLLKHPEMAYSIYFNNRRDGFVFFTAARKDDGVYSDRAVWSILPPQQVKDEKPCFMTVVPVAGKEAYAFETLLKR